MQRLSDVSVLGVKAVTFSGFGLSCDQKTVTVSAPDHLSYTVR